MSMRLEQGIRTELGQRQLLLPRMIQSTEILQLPLAALEQRIEQELEKNPVLELRVRTGPEAPRPTATEEKPLVISDETAAAGFERLKRISGELGNEEFRTDEPYRQKRQYSGDEDPKAAAMANAPDRDSSGISDLIDQWRVAEHTADESKAGMDIIQAIEPDGYLRIDLEQIRQDSGSDLDISIYRSALGKVQGLSPAGVAARNVQERLLLVIEDVARDPDRSEGHDLDLERQLVSHHLESLRLNHYPEIARKTGRSVEEVKRCVQAMGRLRTTIRLESDPELNPAIRPDAVISLDEETGKLEVAMTRRPWRNLVINQAYQKLQKERSESAQTRDYIAGHVQNAKFLIRALEQRASTIERIIRLVADRQREFLLHGPEHIRPLSMLEVATELNVHVATISRAVSEKYVQTERGIIPLRGFFTHAKTVVDGEEVAWDAIKEKLKTLIDAEDKKQPLGDDEIVVALKRDHGIELARRTVAKYRSLLNIPVARKRRAF